MLTDYPPVSERWAEALHYLASDTANAVGKQEDSCAEWSALRPCML